MKRYRLDFSKGINTIGDKGIIGPGWVSVADNVDLRSSSPKPIPGVKDVGDVTVPAGTTCIYKRRGNWLFSANRRFYTAELLNGRDRVYYSEEGIAPRKMIETTDVRLGTPAPLSIPIVTSATYLLPTLTVTQNTGGQFPIGATRSYRVSAETADGIQPACNPVTATATAALTGFTLTWSRVIGTLRYHVYAGDGSEEREIASVGAANIVFYDSGQFGSYGSYASQYDNTANLTYFYTFVREVNTVQDESGPSPTSLISSYGHGRFIQFSPGSDGSLNQEGTVGILAAALTGYNSATSCPAGVPEIASVSYNDLSQTVKFTMDRDCAFGECRKAFFQIPLSPEWNSVELDIIPNTSDTSGKSFYVKSVSIPSSAVGTVTPSITKIESTSFADAGKTPALNDILLLSMAGGYRSGVKAYKVLSYATNVASIEAYTDASPIAFSNAVVLSGVSYAIVFTPKNGYLKFRNIYRVGDTGVASLVKQLPMDQISFVDTVSADNLGNPPDSYYIENGKTIIFAAPPVGLTGLTEHYGMLFGIDGYNVRWTPIGRPDAWPLACSVTFAFKPIALSSFSQGLSILCEDAIYRLDGNSPTMLSLGRTMAENGCIAPHTVQKTHIGLIYLSARGLMLFDGNSAMCLTDKVIPGAFFTGTSHSVAPIAYWLFPTLLTYNYANMAAADGVQGSVTEAIILKNTDGIEGTIYEARSFYHLGRYFIYWPNSNNYEAHTMVCIDLQVAPEKVGNTPQFPITTTSLKPLDAIVDESGSCYFLFSGFPASTSANQLANMELFTIAQCGMTASFDPATDSTLGLAKWDWSNSKSFIPYHIRTGQNALESPATRKKFWDVKLYDTGKPGTLHVRIYIDGRYVCDGRSVTANSPNKIRQVNIPNGANTGYAIDVELAGDVNIRAMEINYDNVNDTK